MEYPGAFAGSRYSYCMISPIREIAPKSVFKSPSDIFRILSLALAFKLICGETPKTGIA
jgi:hypothetical protein